MFDEKVFSDVKDNINQIDLNPRQLIYKLGCKMKNQLGYRIINGANNLNSRKEKGPQVSLQKILCTL